MVGFFLRRLLAVVAIAFVGLGGPQGVKADITYAITDFPADENGWMISGTITTDGTLGDNVTATNIVSWQWTASNAGTGATFSFQDPPSNITSVHTGDVYATAQALSVLDPGVTLTLGNNDGSGPQFLRWVNTGDPTDPNQMQIVAQLGSEGQMFWNVPDTAQFAMIPAAPEPSTLALFSGFGALGMLAGWRKRRRTT